MTFKLCRIASVLFIAIVMILIACSAFAAEAYILGDADTDGNVTVIDATLIQTKLAGLPAGGSYSAAAADVDGNGRVEIFDATYIQRWVAEMDTPYQIGSEINHNQPTVAPSTVPPTQWSTDAEGWGHQIFRP